MYDDLRGKTALVTGAGKKTGIGYAVAEKLALDGAKVIIADLGGPGADCGGVVSSNQVEMEQIAAGLGETYGVETMAVNLDQTSTESVTLMAGLVKDRFGTVDILVNNAGATFGVPNAIHTYDEQAWLRTLDVCLNRVFRVSQAVVPLMTSQGAAIVNTASRAGKVPPLFNGAYAVAKAGVIMMTKVMAKELAGSGIRVNAVCPGQIMTDLEAWRFGLEAQLLGGTPEDREREMCKTIPLNRIGTAAEAAALIVFLASAASSYMTGQAVNVTGGQLMEL
jgi:NAD(P)-dependent dehydrogenase (short-subunit alcohol dehydrogenase family)